MGFQIIQDMETGIELTGLSRDEFAKELGVSRVTLHNWLSGKRDVNEMHMKLFYEYTFNKVSNSAIFLHLTSCM